MPDISVSNVEELYTAVNSSANVNATIHLKAGHYVLSPRDPNGASRPNGGSLFLQPGMALVGQNLYQFNANGDGVPDPRDDNGDGIPDIAEDGREVYADPTSETIIDGSQLDVVLPPPLNIVSGAIVVAGPVEASISNLTVRGGLRTQAEIEIRAPENATSTVTVRECILELGRRGILADSARRWNSNNSTVNLVAERNVIRNHRVDHLLPGVLFGWGIQTQPANISDAKFAVQLSHNRFSGNKIGLFLEVLGAQNGDTTVRSNGNVYENALLTRGSLSSGIFIFIRDAPGNALGSHRNRIRLISNDDAIWNNEGWAGLSVEGIKRVTDGSAIKDNEIDVQLLKTRFVKIGNDGKFDGLQNREARLDPGKTEEEQPKRRRDILILGANNSGTNLREPPPGGFTGAASDNKVKVKVKKATSSPAATEYDRMPQPFVAVDNAPNQVEVELELEEINYIG